MFSTTPSSGTLSFWNIPIALRTSSSATSWGVVTMTTPSSGMTCESESWASPGTGDAQLSLSQVIPLDGVVMVTTPQEVALLDVRKAIGMFQKLNVPLLGVVENMSHFVAPDTGRRYDIFGEGGGRRLAEEYGIPLLAQIPLDPEIRVGGDEGSPIALRRPDSPQAKVFRDLALAVRSRLDELAALERLPKIT